MFGLAIAVAAVFLGAAGLLISFNGLRLRRRVVRDGEALLAGAGPAHPLVRAEIDGLPVPVRRYLTKALGHRPAGIRTLRLTHRGVMRTAPDGRWMPVRGRQYFRADAPAFLWWGRLRVGPGLWVDARDVSIGGTGRMRVQAASTVRLADESGPEIDQGSAMRLLGEMVWFPSALADSGYVSWRGIDEATAEATLRLPGCEVRGLFAFGADGFPVRFSGERYRDTPDGAVLTPWHGEMRDYRAVDGVIVPWELESVWDLPDGPFAPLRFVVEEVAFDDESDRR